MPYCEHCPAYCEWKTTKDISQPKGQKFLSHPYRSCTGYINHEQEKKCDLFKQDFSTPKTCENCGRKCYCLKINDTRCPTVCFEIPGPPWIVHDCAGSKNLVELLKDYRPCTIGDVISNKLHSKILGVKIQIETGRFRGGVMLVICQTEEIKSFIGQIHASQIEKLESFICQLGHLRTEMNKSFIRQLHQPFFYKKNDPDNWILNTFQHNRDLNGKLLYSPREYVCRKIDHWDENQGFFDV
jgi:hypothetical protein